MRITLTANAGFLLEAGGANILFDSFHNQKTGAFPAVPPSVLGDITDGNGRFSRIDAAILTHAHPDHFSAEVLAQFCAKHPATRIIFPAKDDVKNAEYGQSGLKISAGRITHDGAEYAGVPNYGFYIETPEGPFLTLGDAALDYNEISAFLNGRKAGFCALNFPFFALSKGRAILKKLNPSFAAAIHLPFEEDDVYGYNAAVLRAVKEAGFPFETAVLSRPLDEAEFTVR